MKTIITRLILLYSAVNGSSNEVFIEQMPHPVYIKENTTNLPPKVDSTNKQPEIRDLFIPGFNMSVEARLSLEGLVKATLRMMIKKLRGSFVRSMDENTIIYKLSKVLLYDVEYCKSPYNTYGWQLNEYENLYNENSENIKGFHLNTLMKYLANVNEMNSEEAREVEQTNIMNDTKKIIQNLMASRDGDTSVAYVCSLIAKMNSNELKSFFQICYQFVHNNSFPAILLDLFWKETENLKMISDRRMNESQQIPSLETQMIHEASKLAIQDGIMALKPYVLSYLKMKKGLTIELKPDNTVGVTIKNCEPKLIFQLLTLLEKRAGADFPIYELCLKNIKFSAVNENKYHNMTRNIKSIVFQNCTFKDGIFNLTPAGVPKSDKIRELRIINCNIRVFDSNFSYFNNLYVFEDLNTLCNLRNLYDFRDFNSQHGFDNLCILKNLHILDICGCRFNEIPEIIFLMTNLTDLRIRKGLLKEIPKKITKLSRLKTLSFSHNPLRSFPDCIGEIKGLENLILIDDRITFIPPSINELKNLKMLILDSNNLYNWIKTAQITLKDLKYLSMRECKLDKFFSQTSFNSGLQINLKGIEGLDLSFNEFLDFPEAVAKIEKLKLLVIESNKFQLDQSSKAIDLHLPMLEKLVLSNTVLLYFPQFILNMNNLKELWMSGCRVESIPKEISGLHKLIKLDISSNGLVSFPTEVTNLLNLEYLNLSNNFVECDIKNTNLGKLTCLRTLKMSDLGLSGDLNQEIATLAHLRSLDLSYNQVHVNIENLQELRELNSRGVNSFSSCIFKLFKIRILKIGSNNFSSIPDEIRELRDLQELEISRCSSLRSHDIFSELTSLRILKIDDNPAFTLPEEFSNLKELRELYMSHNQLLETPVTVFSFEMLEILDLSHNQITQIPTRLSELPNLKVLKINNNSIRVLPAEISRFSCLETLNTSTNEITEISAELSNLSSLEKLNVSSNEITELPAELSNLSSLKSLDVNFNNIATIPVEFSQLLNLETLNIRNSNITNLPAEFADLPNFRRLYISSSNTPLPEWIFNLPRLQVVAG